MTFDPTRPVRQKNGRKAVFLGKTRAFVNLWFALQDEEGAWEIKVIEPNGKGPSDQNKWLENIPKAKDEWEYTYSKNQSNPPLLNDHPDESWTFKDMDGGYATWYRRKVAASPDTKEPSAGLSGFSVIDKSGYIRQTYKTLEDAQYDNSEGWRILDRSKIPASAIVKREKITRKVWVIWGGENYVGPDVWQIKPTADEINELKITAIKEVELTDGEGL